MQTFFRNVLHKCALYLWGTLTNYIYSRISNMTLNLNVIIQFALFDTCIQCI